MGRGTWPSAVPEALLRVRRDLGGTVITPRWQPRSCFTGSCAAEGLRAGHNGWGRPLTSSNPRGKERACLVPYPGSSRRQRLPSERTCVRCRRTRLVGRATTTSHPATGCAGERKRRAPAGQHQTQYTLARAIFENPQFALFGRPEQVPHDKKYLKNTTFAGSLSAITRACLFYGSIPFACVVR